MFLQAFNSTLMTVVLGWSLDVKFKGLSEIQAAIFTITSSRVPQHFKVEIYPTLQGHILSSMRNFNRTQIRQATKIIIVSGVHSRLLCNQSRAVSSSRAWIRSWLQTWSTIKCFVALLSRPIPTSTSCSGAYRETSNVFSFS